MVTAAVQARNEGYGSVEEKLVFLDLIRRGLKEGLDFEYQSALWGGRLDLGGQVIDFLFRDRGLAINPLGEYYHGTPEARARDLIARALLAGQGIQLIFIDAADVNRDTHFYVGEALAFRDLSRLARGLY